MLLCGGTVQLALPAQEIGPIIFYRNFIAGHCGLFCSNAQAVGVILAEKAQFFLNFPDDPQGVESVFAADAGRFFASDAVDKVSQLGLQRLVGRNEQLFNAALRP